jgi:DHA3 family macrolide efflux protein-like MFS transporter
MSEIGGAAAGTQDEVPMRPTDPMSMGAVLKIKPMRHLWYAQIVSTFGDFVALFAVITVLTFRLHATPQQITGVQIAYMLPIALLGIVSGVFVDRWPLKRTLVASDFIRAVLVLLLVFVHGLWGYYIVLAAVSVFSSVFGPAQGVAVRSLVPIHGMRSAQALLQQVMFVMRIVGGPIASLLLVYASVNVSFYADAISFVISGLLMASLALPAMEKTPPATAEQKGGLSRVLSDMKQGTSFIVHHAALFFVITAMGAGMFILGCFGPLIAVYVRDTLHASTRTFGTASAMIGVGIMAGINLLNALAKHVKNSTQVYLGLTGIAIGTLALALFPNLPVTIVALLLIGFAVAGIIVPAQTLIQQETPQAMLGRVGSTVMSLIFSAQIAGLLLSGVLANHMSVRGVFGICSGMLVLLLIAGKLWMEPGEHVVAAA